MRPRAARGPPPRKRRSSRRSNGVSRRRGRAAPPRPLEMESPRFGLGFRTQYAEAIALAPRSVDWLEVVSDHYLGVGGPRRALLERLCREHPIALHGVGLGIAGSDPHRAELSRCALRARGALRAPLRERSPVLDILRRWAVPRSAPDRVHGGGPFARRPSASRACRTGSAAGSCSRTPPPTSASAPVRWTRPSSWPNSAARPAAAYCSTSTTSTSTQRISDPIPRARSICCPRARWATCTSRVTPCSPDVRIDTHADPVPSPVWQLFAAAVQRFPRADVILERDDDLPPYAQLVAELDEARARHAAALAGPLRSAPPGRPSHDAPARSPHPGTADWSSLQRAFWQRVVAPHEDADPVALGEILEDRLPVRAARGMRVYSDGYLASLRDALATNFASLARVLGAADWERLCAAYLAAHPPRGHGFVGLGAAFAEFVREHSFATDYGVPQCVLAEMAELEQAQLEAQDAPDPEHTVAPAELAAIDPADWERTRLAFAPTVRMVRASHDVAPVVLAASRGEAPERPRAGEQAYLVARRGSGVETEPLAPGDAALIEALLAGRAFGDACAAARDASGADEVRAAEQGARFLVQASAMGWIAGLTSVTHPDRGPDLRQGFTARNLRLPSSDPGTDLRPVFTARNLRLSVRAASIAARWLLGQAESFSARCDRICHTLFAIFGSRFLSPHLIRRENLMAEAVAALPRAPEAPGVEARLVELARSGAPLRRVIAAIGRAARRGARLGSTQLCSAARLCGRAARSVCAPGAGSGPRRSRARPACPGSKPPSSPGGSRGRRRACCAGWRRRRTSRRGWKPRTA